MDPNRHGPGASAKPARNWLAPASLLALAFIVYLPAVSGRFVWDDVVLIQNNPHLRSLGGLWRMWSTLGDIRGEEHYWPLQYTFLWLEYQFFGNWTSGYHIVNMALHGAIAIQIWRLMRRLNLPGAWLAAALFTVHPVHAEVVAWIFSVKDLLTTFLFLIIVEMHLNLEERGGWRWLAGAIVVAAAMMLIKSTPLLLPAALAILIWYRRGRISARESAGLAALAVVTFAFTLFDIWVVKINNVGADWPIRPLVERIMQAGLAFPFYLGKLITPIGLSPIYPQWVFKATDAMHWLPLGLVSLATILLWAARGRIGRGPLACWLFYGVMLGPALGIVFFGFLQISPVADRYQYLPSLGPLAGFGALAGGWMIDPKRRAWVLGSAAAVLFLLSAGTWRQAGFYRNEVTFFSRALDIAPESSLAHYNLGHNAFDMRQYEMAENLFAEAHRLNPRDGDTIFSLGMAMIRQGKYRDAAAVYEDAMMAGSMSSNIWANLALLLASAPDATVRDPQRALVIARECEQRTDNLESLYLAALAAAEAANGQAAQAAETARRALELARQQQNHYMIQEIEKALAEYERGKPYIMPPGGR